MVVHHSESQSIQNPLPLIYNVSEYFNYMWNFIYKYILNYIFLKCKMQKSGV